MNFPSWLVTFSNQKLESQHTNDQITQRYYCTNSTAHPHTERIIPHLAWHFIRFRHMTYQKLQLPKRVVHVWPWAWVLCILDKCMVSTVKCSLNQSIECQSAPMKFYILYSRSKLDDSDAGTRTIEYMPYLQSNACRTSPYHLCPKRRTIESCSILFPLVGWLIDGFVYPYIYIIGRKTCKPW